LALIVIGTGFFKPCVSVMVGQLYGPEDSRRDSGFTIFYMGINLGAFLSPLIAGTLGQKVGWLEFRYYDGTVWSDSWDSRSQRRLPVAVEVKFQLVDLPEDDAAVLNDEQQAEAELQDMGADQTEAELDNTALLEGEAPEWAGQQEGDFAVDQQQTPSYYRCVIYLEPPKEWPEQTFAEEDEEGALGADDTGAEMTAP